jgi:hypothetical protein
MEDAFRFREGPPVLDHHAEGEFIDGCALVEDLAALVVSDPSPWTTQGFHTAYPNNRAR